MAEEKKTCYVICPIGEPESDTRKRSDKIFKHIIKPAVEQSGYETPLRSDMDVKSDMITPAIFKHIIDDALVIADLTGPNANVFYELGVRHSFRKPVIHLLEKGERPPFDAYDIRAIEVSNDLDVASVARGQIVDRIKAIEKGCAVNSPVRVAATLALSETAAGDAKSRILHDVFQLCLLNRQELAAVKELVVRMHNSGNVVYGRPLVASSWSPFPGVAGTGLLNAYRTWGTTTTPPSEPEPSSAPQIEPPSAPQIEPKAGEL